MVRGPDRLGGDELRRRRRRRRAASGGREHESGCQAQRLPTANEPTLLQVMPTFLPRRSQGCACGTTPPRSLFPAVAALNRSRGPSTDQATASPRSRPLEGRRPSSGRGPWSPHSSAWQVHRHPPNPQAAQVDVFQPRRQHGWWIKSWQLAASGCQPQDRLQQEQRAASSPRLRRAGHRVGHRSVQVARLRKTAKQLRQTVVGN